MVRWFPKYWGLLGLVVISSTMRISQRTNTAAPPEQVRAAVVHRILKLLTHIQWRQPLHYVRGLSLALARCGEIRKYILILVKRLSLPYLMVSKVKRLGLTWYLSTQTKHYHIADWLTWLAWLIWASVAACHNTTLKLWVNSETQATEST